MIKNSKKRMALIVMASLFLITTLNAQMDYVSNAMDYPLNLNNVVYLEEEEEIDLDFDTYFYLPKNFNPYKGMHFELKDIMYLECGEEIRLDSDPDILFP